MILLRLCCSMPNHVIRPAANKPASGTATRFRNLLHFTGKSAAQMRDE
jgi:hypothetical protein